MSTSNDPNPPDRPPHDQPPHDQPPGYDQQGYGQQGYGQPAAPGYGESVSPGYGDAHGHGGAPANPKNGMGIAALIVAVIALVLCWLPVIGGLIALIGLILGVVARGKAKRGQATNGGMALVAVIISALALVINIAIIAFAFFIGSQVQDCATLPAAEQQACIEDQLSN